MPLQQVMQFTPGPHWLALAAIAWWGVIILVHSASLALSPRTPAHA